VGTAATNLMMAIARLPVNAAWITYLSERLNDLPALDNPDQNDDDRHHQKDVYEPTHGVRRDQTQTPEDQQNNCNGLKHGLIVSGGWQIGICVL
jgi:hypothetical protein